jgi:hypothetical protein
MDMRERHIGKITRNNNDSSEAAVDVGALIRRLLLFEHCTLESGRLVEVPALVRTFGMKGLEALLDSGAISIVCDAITMGNVGQNTGREIIEATGGPLPMGAYRIATVRPPDSGPEREKYIHDALQSVHQAPGTLKQQIRLKKKLVPLLIAYPQRILPDTLASFEHIIEREILPFQRSLQVACRDATGIDLPGPVELRAKVLGNSSDFQISTDLGKQAALHPEEVDKIVERALLGAAGVEQRLHVMQAFESVSGFRDSEVPVFEDRLDVLAAQLDPDRQERRFERVAAIAGVPALDDLQADQQIDMNRLLKLRDSDQCREFRAWLRRIDSESDQEIDERFASIRERLASITNTRTARTVRFLVPNGLGALPPPFGLIAGPAASLADKFIIDKLLGQPGPVSFLGRSYPSIFPPDKHRHDNAPNSPS